MNANATATAPEANARPRNPVFRRIAESPPLDGDQVERDLAEPAQDPCEDAAESHLDKARQHLERACNELLRDVQRAPHETKFRKVARLSLAQGLLAALG